MEREKIFNIKLKNDFEDYCKKHFSNIELVVQLFFQTSIGIRFEIGTGHFSDPDYVKRCVFRARNIFNDLFQDNDDVYIVANSHETFPDDICTADISSLKPLIYNYDECFFPYQSINDKDWRCERYILKTNIKDFDVSNVLESIIWSDVDGRNDLQTCVFIINPRNNVIFQLYDDRGLDVISDKYESLYKTYKKYSDWILNYNRKEIENRFEDYYITCKSQ